MFWRHLYYPEIRVAHRRHYSASRLQKVLFNFEATLIDSTGRLCVVMLSGKTAAGLFENGIQFGFTAVLAVGDYWKPVAGITTRRI